MSAILSHRHGRATARLRHNKWRHRRRRFESLESRHMLNAAPEAADDFFTSQEDTVFIGNLLANDSDLDGDMLELVSTTEPQSGTLVTDSVGNFIYTPKRDFVGDASFTYTISDGNGGADTASATVSVTNINDKPDATNDVFSASERKITINVLGNDIDVDLTNPVHTKFNTDPPDALRVIAVENASGGQAELNADGSVSFTPNKYFAGAASFNYTVSDRGQDGIAGTSDDKTDTATVHVNVFDPYYEPIAGDDSFTVNKASIRTPLDVLRNDDVAIFADPLRVTAISQGANGTVEIGANGASVLYTPDPNFLGSDSFSYTVADSHGATDTAMVTVAVINVDTNFQGTPGDDVFLVRGGASGRNVQVFANVFGTGTPIVSVPVDSANPLVFDTLGGDDRLIIEVSYASRIPLSGIQFLGGSNGTAGDRLILRGGNSAGVYTPDPSTAGNGMVVAGGNITLTGIEPIDVSRFEYFTVITPNSSDDTLSLTSQAAGMAQLSGSSGPVTLSPITFTNVATLFINADRESRVGNDALTVNFPGAVPFDFVYYRSGGGNNTLTIESGAARIDADVHNNATLATTVHAGAELITRRFRQTSLTLEAGSKATILPVEFGTITSVLRNLQIDNGATLDINDTSLIIDYAGASPAATIRSKLIEGRGENGTWNGTGITSSTAQQANATQPGVRSIGYAENSWLPLGPYTIFRHERVDDTSVLIAYTRTGDANLDGVVGDADVTIVGATYAPGVPQPQWALGDFDYNGFVDDGDVTLLGALYDPAADPFAAPPPQPMAADESLIDLLAMSIASELASQAEPAPWPFAPRSPFDSIASCDAPRSGTSMLPRGAWERGRV